MGITMTETEAAGQVTEPGHIQFGGFLIGPGTPYRWREVKGWEELPGLDSGTALRSGEHGGVAGQLLAQTRTIEVEDMIVRAPADEVGATVAAFRQATTIGQDEQPLIVQVDESGPMMVFARVTRRHLPVNKGYRVGTIVGGAIVFEASDPRRYEVVERTTSTGLPQPEPGLTWGAGGLDWAPSGLNWGQATSTGDVGVLNTGDAPAHPVIEFHGPVDTPSITRLSDGLMLEYAISLAAGEVLSIDTWRGTVELNGLASRLYTATSRSAPEASFTLEPGATSLAFRNGSGGMNPSASCTVRWRSASW